MSIFKLILPALALALTFGFANAGEKKATLAYYYIDG
jgi:hypothetical protein